MKFIIFLLYLLTAVSAHTESLSVLNNLNSIKLNHQKSHSNQNFYNSLENLNSLEKETDPSIENKKSPKDLTHHLFYNTLNESKNLKTKERELPRSEKSNYHLLNQIKKTDLENYFSKNYIEARRKFRNLSANYKNAYTGKIQIQSSQDSDLTIDFTHIPAQNKLKNLVIVTSGVHGAEAFAGSAMQLQLLENLKTLNQTGVLLIHSINPYGFKNIRRSTENNIDLNRNFILNENIFQTVNKGYNIAKPLLERNTPIKNLNKHARQTFFGFLKLVLIGNSISELVQAIGQGQYHSPLGLYYGGQFKEQQYYELKNLIEHYSSFYEQVAFVDIHTGIGKQSQLVLMTGKLTTPQSWNELNHFFKESDFLDLYNGAPGAQLVIEGDIVDFASSLLKNKKLFSVTAEYGTLGDDFWTRLTSINRVILENQGHHYGYISENKKIEVQKKFLTVFNPSSFKWQQKVLSKNEKLFNTIFQNLESH